MSKGPTLDQEPMVITDQDPGDENDAQEIIAEAVEATNEAIVTLTLTENEFRVINQTMAAQLFSYYPSLWMANADEEQNRAGMMNMLAVLADRAMFFMSLPEAAALRAKLGDAVKSFYHQKGLDFEEQQAKLVADLKDTFGLEVRDVQDGEATATETVHPDQASPCGCTSEGTDGGRSEPSVGESQDVARADVPGVPAVDPSGTGPKTPDLP